MPRILIAMIATLLIQGPAIAASFDCTKARRADEITICNDRELSELDVRMATWFEVNTSLVLMGRRGAMRDEQSAWLAQRARCRSDKSCLRSAYLNRIAELRKTFYEIRAERPF